MEKYKFLEHTADVKFQAFGKNKEEAFSNAVLATTEVIVGTQAIKKEIEKTISVSGEDDKALLYDLLDQVLYLVDAENFIVSEVKSLKIENNTLTAALIGDDVQNYEAEMHVKAMTYNQMEITDDMVQVVLDI